MVNNNDARINHYLTIFTSILSVMLWLGGNLSLQAGTINGTTNNAATNGSTPSSDPSVSLVAHYPLDFNFNDIAGGNHGAGQGDLDFDQLSNGQGFAELDGLDDYIQVPQNTPLNNLDGMTISYWVKPDNTGKRYTIINKGTSTVREYYSEIVNGSSGFVVIPGNDLTVQPATLIAPSNFIAQYGGRSPQGKHVVYLTWENNSPNQGLVIEITNQSAGCSICSNTVPANAQSFKAYIDDGTGITHNIRIYALGPKGAQSIKTYALIKLNGDVVPPSANSIFGSIPRDGRWHQLTQSRSSNVYKSYIDGQLIYSGSGPVRRQGTAPLLIGASAPPQEVVNIVRTSGGTSTITWDAVVGHKYLVQYKETPMDPEWIDLPPVMTADGVIAEKIDKQNFAGQRVYRVLHLDPNAYKGGLADVKIYSRALADTEITSLFAQSKGRFRIIANFVSVGYFDNLPEPQFSRAMDELEQLSLQYASVWNSPLPTAVDIVVEAESYLKNKWEVQIKSQIALWRIMEKYGILPSGITADGLVAINSPKWEALRVKKAWFQDPELAATPQARAAIDQMQPLAAQSPLAAAGGQSPLMAAMDADDDEEEDGRMEFCSFTRSFSALFEAVPFALVFTQYDNPITPPPPSQIQLLNWFNAGVYYQPFDLSKPAGPCSEPSDHLVSDSGISYKVTEKARFNTILFDGRLFTKLQYDAAAWVSPTKTYQRTYEPDGSYAEQSYTRYMNLRAAEAPPQFPPIYSLVARQVWKVAKAHWDDNGWWDSGRTNVSTRDWMYDSHLAKGRNPIPFTSADVSLGPPDGAGRRTAGVQFKIDSLMDDYPIFINNWARNAGYVIDGALRGVGYRVIDPIEANVFLRVNPFSSKVIELNLDVPLGRNGSFRLKYIPIGHGKGDAGANAVNCGLDCRF